MGLTMSVICLFLYVPNSTLVNKYKFYYIHDFNLDDNFFSSIYFNAICLEKEAVRQLITKAIKGLEENGRIQSSTYYNENTKSIQVNMDSFGSLLANR